MIGIMYWVPAAVLIALLVLNRDDLGPVVVAIYAAVAMLGGIVILGVLRMPPVVLAAWLSLLALVAYFQVKLRALNL